MPASIEIEPSLGQGPTTCDRQRRQLEHAQHHTMREKGRLQHQPIVVDGLGRGIDPNEHVRKPDTPETPSRESTRCAVDMWRCKAVVGEIARNDSANEILWKRPEIRRDSFESCPGRRFHEMSSLDVVDTVKLRAVHVDDCTSRGRWWSEQVR